MIRRYSTIRPSRGTVIPASVRAEVRSADLNRCVGPRVGMPGECFGSLEWDHVRAGGVGMKSPSVKSNGVTLCSIHHRVKTNAGKTWRPRLLDYIEARDSA